MNKRFKKPENYQIPYINFNTKELKTINKLKEIMIINDQRLNDFKTRTFPRNIVCKRDTSLTKYYKQDTRSHWETNNTLKIKGVFKNIDGKNQKDFIYDEFMRSYQKKDPNNGTNNKTLSTKFNHRPYMPLKCIKILSNAFNKKLDNIENKFKSSIPIFKELEGKLCLVMVDEACLIRKDKIELRNSPQLKCTMKKCPKLNDKDFIANTLLNKSKIQEIKISTSEDELSSFIQQIGLEGSFSESLTLFIKSLEIDDDDLLSTNFRSIGSNIQREPNFPTLNKILKYNNESVTYNVQLSEPRRSYKNDKVLFNGMYLKGLIERHTDATSEIMANFILENNIELILQNDFHIAQFERVKIYDELLTKDLLQGEELEFQLAIQYTESFITKSKIMKERSSSGSKKRVSKNKNIIKYYGNFGFIDGIDLVGGTAFIENQLSLFKSKSTTQTERENSGRRESFEALSHMCHLKELISGTSIFRKSISNVKTMSNLESSLRQFVIVNNDVSSDSSVVSEKNPSLCSIDHDLINDFTRRITNDLRISSKSSLDKL